jgi:hypothetical protein
MIGCPVDLQTLWSRLAARTPPVQPVRRPALQSFLNLRIHSKTRPQPGPRWAEELPGSVRSLLPAPPSAFRAGQIEPQEISTGNSANIFLTPLEKRVSILADTSGVDASGQFCRTSAYPKICWPTLFPRRDRSSYAQQSRLCEADALLRCLVHLLCLAIRRTNNPPCGTNVRSLRPILR